MAGTAYHMEALRRQRVLERKAEAVKRIEDTIGQSGAAADLARDLKQSQLVFSEQGQYAQNRSSNTPQLSKEVDGVVFEEVVHDPNFKYRIQKETGNTPEHVDPIYKIMYPGYSRYPPPQTNYKKFVRRDPEMWPKPKPEPKTLKNMQRDQVYYCLHPKKLNYYKIGPERDRRQYDHSRNGPVVDRTNYELRREFNFLGQSLGMVKDDIRPLHLPTPSCRRF